MSKPIEGCPQPDEPMRERAWTAEQVEAMATAAVIPIGSPIATMLRAYAATLRQQQDYPECSGNPMSCPENEGFGCCAKHAEQITLRQQAEHSFASPQALADWLESLHETNDDGAITGGKWEPAQVAACAIRSMGQQAKQGGRVDACPNDDAGHELATKHHLFIYEVDFGDEGKGRYIRLGDFNKTVERLEAALAQNAQGEAVGEIVPRFEGHSVVQLFDADLPLGTKLYTHDERASVPAGLDGTELAELARTHAAFNDGVDTETSFATLLRWTEMGLLEVEEFFFTKKGLDLLAAAPSQPEDAGEVDRG